jgi:hypothetical protein
MKRIILSTLVIFLLLMVPAWVLADVAIVITVWPMVGPTVSASAATNITPISGTLNGNIVKTGNNDPSVRGFEWGNSTGNYTSSWNETGSYGVGSFSYTVTNLTLGEQIFWRAFATNTIKTGYSSEESFTTYSLPFAPTDFTITQVGTNSINVTWTKGLGATTTPIKGSLNSYPGSIDDGYLVYNGTDDWTLIEGVSLTLDTYFYSAWGENTFGLSEGYAKASIGGNMIPLLCILAVCIFLMVMAYRTRELLVCTLSFFAWFGLGLWLFFSGSGFFDLEASYSKIFTYVFIGIAFVPLIWSMNRSIKFEASGKKSSTTWEEEGSPPPTTKKVSETERYYSNKERVRKRLER